MNKLLLFLMFGILLISSVSAFDAELPYCQGGDGELIICFGDEELTFLAGLPGAEAPTGGPGAGVEPTPTELEYEDDIKPKFPFLFSIVSFFGIEGEDVLLFEILIISMIGLIFFIFVKERKKKKKEKKEKEKKDE